MSVNTKSTSEAHDHDDVSVTSAAGGVVLLAENVYRQSALIINTGEAAMRVTTDGTAPTATKGKLIPGGASLSMTSPGCSFQAVKAFSTEGTTANASEVD